MEDYTLIGILIVVGVLFIFYIIYKIMFRNSSKPTKTYNNYQNTNDDEDEDEDEENEYDWYLEEDLY